MEQPGSWIRPAKTFTFNMPSPGHTAAWVLNSQNGIDSLTLVEQLPLPRMKEDEVLVKIHAVSLNARDLMIAKVNSLHQQSIQCL